MKTVKNLLCVVLCLLMAVSPLSLVAFAEETAEPDYTYSLKYYTEKNDAYFADIVLDAIDELLAGLNDGEGITFSVDALGISIDLRSVNGVCDTLDLLKDLLTRDKIIDTDYSSLLGDLKYLNLGVWKEGMQRGSQDATILKEILELLGTTEPKKLLVGSTTETNPAIIAGLLDGDASLGVLDNFFSINDLLGEEGISGILKDIIFGLVANKDTETAKFNELKSTYNNNVDAFVYGPLLTKYAGEYLNGFTMTKDTTVEVLICSVFNALIENYVLEWVGGINIDLTAQGNEDLAKLAGVINLDGSTYNLDGIALDPNVGLLEQANDLVGKIFAQLVPGFTWVTGDYTKISKNIENLFKYVGAQSGLIPEADSMTREEIVMAIIEIILSNVDIGAYGAGLTECKTLKDMAKVALVNTARELDITYTYDADDDYLVVLGDILAVWAYDNFGIEDLSGKAYRGGKGDDVWTVANYFVNYFLFEKDAAELFNLNVKATDTLFKKIDEVVDLFGKNGELGFNSKTFINGLLDNAFKLDVQAILELTAVPAIEMAGDVKAVEFVYNTIRYLLNNWSDKNAIVAYSGSTAFTTLLTNKNIANLLKELLVTINERKDSLVTVALFIAGLIMNDEVVDLGAISATVSDTAYTGKTVAPKATVKLGSTTLKQNTDYVVLTDGVDMGKATATVKLIGKYKGPDVTAEYDIVYGKLTGLTASVSGDDVTAKWTALPGTEKYLVTIGDKTVEVAADKTSYKMDRDYGKKYTVKVTAVCGDETSSASTSIYTAPGKVGGLKISDVEDDSLKLTWSKVSGAKGYQVYRSTDGKKWTSLGTTTKTSYTVKSLKSYTKYYFKVRAYTLNGDDKAYGSYSDVKNTTTDLGKVDVDVTTTKDTVKLSWDKVNGAKTYRIEKKDGKKWVKVTETKSTSYTFKKLKSETKYEYRVRAQVSSKVYSGYDTVSATTKVSKVSSLKATSITENSVKLTWSKKSGATEYTIYKSTDGKKWTKVGTAKSSATSYTVKSLDFSTSYKFKVVAKTKKTTSEDATVSAKTSAGKVTGLKTTSVKKTSIALQWSKKSGATSYELQYSKDGKNWTTVKTTKTSTTVSGLTRSTNYQFRVRAINKAGKSGYSSVVKAKTSLF